MAVIKLAEEQKYYDTMSGQDAFTVVIRGAAYLDHELGKLLASTAAEPRYLEKMNLDYEDRCLLAFALGLAVDLKPALTTVGSLRNALAHQPQRELQAGDATDLFNKLPSDMRESIPKMLRDRVISPKVTSFNNLNPLDKYVLMLVMLRAAITAARHQVEDARPK